MYTLKELTNTEFKEFCRLTYRTPDLYVRGLREEVNIYKGNKRLIMDRMSKMASINSKEWEEDKKLLDFVDTILHCKTKELELILKKDFNAYNRS